MQFRIQILDTFLSVTEIRAYTYRFLGLFCLQKKKEKDFYKTVITQIPERR